MAETPGYREKISAAYPKLSRSYRRVADYALSSYYEVAFMTAAQLAYYVGVDTTTVVRFAQRLGYNGYPELLHDIRAQVRAEIYAAYSEPAPEAGETAALFGQRIARDQHSLSQTLVHNPPEHVARVAALLRTAPQIVLIGEGYAHALAEMTAQQLRHLGRPAYAAPSDTARLSSLLAVIEPGTLVVGICCTAYGREVARAMEFARARGCTTLGVVGNLASPVNRMADLLVFAPAENAGPLPSLTALTSALSGLAALVDSDAAAGGDGGGEAVAQVYEFLVQPDAVVPEDEP